MDDISRGLTHCERLRSCSDHYFTFNGKIVTNADFAEQNASLIRIHPRLVGGKGGFGSMLRALGAQIEKTTNREACRDLSGRRMRDVNNEKKIADWLSKQEEKEAEKKKKRQETLERVLNPPKHMMDSQGYIHSIQDTAEDIDNALKHGLSQNGSKGERVGLKRPANGVLKAPKKPKGWLGLDGDDLEDDDNEDQEDEPIASPEPRDKTIRSDHDVLSKGGPENHLKLAEASDEGHTEAVKATEPRAADGPIEITKGESVKGCSDVEKPNEEASQVPKKDNKPEPINLDLYDTVEELESLGLERLKQGLMAVGLKCGGTLMQRAERLFLLKTTPLEKLDRMHFAASNGKTLKKAKKT